MPEEIKETNKSIPSLEKENLELTKESVIEEQESKIEIAPAKIEEKKEEATAPAAVSVQDQQQIQQHVKQIKNLDQENQVKRLCDLAFAKNLNFAIQVARNLDNAYVLDEFHDALVDQLYRELVAKKKLGEI